MMIFESIDVKYTCYDSDTLIKKFNLSKSTAEDLNKVIAVYNKYNKKFKIDGSVIGELALIEYFKKLDDMEIVEAINVLIDGNTRLNPVTKHIKTLDEY